MCKYFESPNKTIVTHRLGVAAFVGGVQMSELKYYKLRHIVSALASPDFRIGVVFGDHDEVYNRPDVDEVIAELKKACTDKDNWCLHTLKENRHHKYKRCIKMAEWCEACLNQFPSFGAISKKEEWWQKWHDRWYDIAQNFKEDS